MACRTCQPCSPTDQSCITTPVVLAPCACPETPATRAEGPPGTEGPVGDVVAFTVGTVTEGSAAVSFVEDTDTEYTVNFVIPSPPTNVANEWIAVQTYDMQAVFVEGLVTNNGTSTFGGTGFTVSPDATFDGNLSIGGDESIAGNLTIGGNESVTGTLTVGGASTFGATEIDGALTFGTSATLVVPTITPGTPIRGTLALDSCNKPVLVADRGSDLYYENTSSLLTVTTGTDGPICAPFGITIPASVCLPQLTPSVDIMVRVSYHFSAAAAGQATAKLWLGTIDVGTLLDSEIIGASSFGTGAGIFFLRARHTFQLGLNTINVEIENGTNHDCIGVQANIWVSN